MAGPVCAAAVIFCYSELNAESGKKNWISAPPIDKQAFVIMTKKGLCDSKKLSTKQRERWYEILTNHPQVKWGIGLVSEKIIDKTNILEATKLAMRQAVKNLAIEPDYLLLDGKFILENLDISQKSFIRGDEKIISCAAASIIAKVTRDRLMQKYHKKFPQYGFDRHKGYGTKAHCEAIKKHGSCKIHRRSFHPVKSR